MFHGPTELLWISLFDRINLSPQIQIRYIDTKHQLACMLTKGNFTRDEWNILLHLFNISHFSFHLVRWEFQPDKLSQKVGEEDAGTERWRKNRGTIQTYSDELVFSCSDKFLLRKKSDCIQKSRDTHSYGETWEQDEKKFEIRRSVEFSTTAARCTPWRVDGHSNGESCRNKRGIREYGPFRIGNLEFSRRGSDGETRCL